MRDLRRLTILWVSTACYKDSFTVFYCTGLLVFFSYSKFTSCGAMPALYNTRILLCDHFLSILLLHLHNNHPESSYSSSFGFITWDIFAMANSYRRIGHPFRQGRPHKLFSWLCCLENSLYNLYSCFGVIKYRKAYLILGSRATLGKLPTAYIVVCPTLNICFVYSLLYKVWKYTTNLFQQSRCDLKTRGPAFAWRRKLQLWQKIAGLLTDLNFSSKGRSLQSQPCSCTDKDV
jgi:hypothetical protein